MPITSEGDPQPRIALAYRIETARNRGRYTLTYQCVTVIVFVTIPVDELRR